MKLGIARIYNNFKKIQIKEKGKKESWLNLFLVYLQTKIHLDLKSMKIKKKLFI